MQETLLHIMPDDKFIDAFIKQTIKLGIGKHTFLIRKARPFKYVTSDLANGFDLLTTEFREFIGDINRFDRVLIHNMDFQIGDWLIVNKIKREIIWVFFGSEFYYQSGVPLKVYDAVTRKVLGEIGRRNVFIAIKKQYESFTRNRFLRNQKKRLLSQVSHIYHYNKYDFELVGKYFRHNAKFVPFFYTLDVDFSYLDKFVKPRVNPQITILLGNSGDPSNNHVSMMNSLEKMKGNDFQIIAPLSYGNTEYIKRLNTIGHEKFGKKFSSISNYMSYDKYLGVLSNVDVGIMNHRRSQAMGNIITLLYLGKKVFMQSTNPAYLFLVDLGVRVFDVLAFEREFRKPLDNESILNNQGIIANSFSHSRAQELIKNTLNE